MFRYLGSTRFTLVGMLLLAVGAGLSYGNPDSVSVWVIILPLLILALNLSVAILTNSKINRRIGLLIFHVGLLALISLVAIGRLHHFESHVELVKGASFSSKDTFDVKKGPLYSGGLDEVQFVQENFSVNYGPGVSRGLTFNWVSVVNNDGRWERQVFGDDRPLLINGYRFYTTFNKGFAVLLTWKPEVGDAVSGVVHMPSYPLFEHKQSNEWKTPQGQNIKFWLRLNTDFDEKTDWVFEPEKAKGALVINLLDKRTVLKEGEKIPLNGGVLVFDRLTSWMGYKVFYDPTLVWLFVASIFSVLGLVIHFWQKGARKTVSYENTATFERSDRRLLGLNK